MKKSQSDTVLAELRLNGRVSRNWALKQYITRLAAIILELNKAGYVIEGRMEKYTGGRDYVYTLVSLPNGK